MVKDKFSAVWVSHSSIGDWRQCPRAYWLKNVYKNPKTGRKMTLMSPPLALGQAVHEVIESLSVIATDKRFSEPLLNRLETVWQKISGKKGGFADKDEEFKYKERGKEMLRRVEQNPGPLKNLAVKIQMELPYYWLSEKDNIILCGKIDWMEYLANEEAVHIIDFKTGKQDENENSLQLPIYYLLASNTQARQVKKLSYWYIDRCGEPAEQKLTNLKTSEENILKLAKEMKLARQLNRFKCPNNGRNVCKPMEKIITGQAEMVSVDEMNREVYILPTKTDERKSEIL